MVFGLFFKGGGGGGFPGTSMVCAIDLDPIFMIENSLLMN
jgi:hypothetical protein